MVTELSHQAQSRKRAPRTAGQRGALMTELIIAIALLVAAVLPLAYSWVKDADAVRLSYWRAVAMELVDGELEVLANGEWRNFSPGAHSYPVTANAATNLPPGQFTLTIHDRHVRLQWKSDRPRGIGPVERETEAR
jgi:hypothetical protein